MIRKKIPANVMVQGPIIYSKEWTTYFFCDTETKGTREHQTRENKDYSGVIRIRQKDNRFEIKGSVVDNHSEAKLVYVSSPKTFEGETARAQVEEEAIKLKQEIARLYFR